MVPRVAEGLGMLTWTSWLGVEVLMVGDATVTAVFWMLSTRFVVRTSEAVPLSTAWNRRWMVVNPGAVTRTVACPLAGRKLSWI